MITLTPTVELPEDSIELSAVRAQGAGGQHVNKTSSAVQLRFDIRASVLPEDWKQRLLAKRDHRITDDGLVVIKSQQFRSQEMNREAAIERLRVLLLSVAVAPKTRKATRPTAASKRKRLESKQRQGRIKALRSSRSDD